MIKRLNSLDNLRTFLIFLVIVLHSGLVYEAVLEKAWIVVDPAKANALGLLRMYLDLFVIFMLFYISGYFVRTSLENKSASAFLMAKFQRIMLPWLLAVLVLVPAYKLLFLYSRGLPQETWYTYFHFYARAGSDLSNFANNPTQNWLWFLPVLFCFQVAFLILYKAGFTSNRISIKKALSVLFVIGAVYASVISILGLKGWFDSWLLHFQRERLLIYFMAFLLGDLSFQKRIFDNYFRDKSMFVWVNVGFAVSLTVFTIVALNLFFNLVDPQREFYFTSPLFDRIIYYASSLLSTLGFLYLLLDAFLVYFNKSNNLLKTMSSSSYSVYIIHVVVMGVIAVALLPMPFPAIIKFLLLTSLTYVLSTALVVLYVRFLRRRPALKRLAYLLLVIGVFGIIEIGKSESDSSEYATENAKMTGQVSQEIGLHEAVIANDIEAVKYHIMSSANLNEVEPSGGSTPLITAAVFGSSEIAQLLIDSGAALDTQNFDGSTALFSAAFFGRVEIVKMLLKAGADISIVNNQEATALQVCKTSFDQLKPVYDYFLSSLGPLGLELNYEELKDNRKIIASLLEDHLQ